LQRLACDLWRGLFRVEAKGNVTKISGLNEIDVLAARCEPSPSLIFRRK